jgi:murein DD-endopeptidase MepM/ murein hydrolase activator NlpD
MAEIQAPTKNYVSQGKHGKFNAVDYAARTSRLIPVMNSRNIYAVEDGTITAYAYAGTMGNRLELTSTDKKRRWGHGHLEKSYVKVGQKVVRGQLIGVMGHTGLTKPSGYYGIHLHLVCLTGGKYVYPPTLMKASFRGYALGYPKTVKTTDRLNVREKPTTKSKVTTVLNKGTAVKVVAAVKGESVSKNNKWYKTSSGKYIWSGATKG